jgi:hypothetical protein
MPFSLLPLLIAVMVSGSVVFQVTQAAEKADERGLSSRGREQKLIRCS